MRLAAVIPAYNPSEKLFELVSELTNTEFAMIVVVDDGSNKQYEELFQKVKHINKVVLLKHGINLGKGAALKTGMNHAFCYVKDLKGVVTVDADGQHLLHDVLKVAAALKEHPQSLILGSRQFDENVPFRSQFGNSLTRLLLHCLMGQRLRDTQTGLRGIPNSFIPILLKITLSGYEYELEMLMASKYGNRQLIEVPIQTVYIDGNSSSHFNPIWDSMRIYFVLFRFTLSSLLTATLDYSVFIITFHFSASLLGSQAIARLIALFFNYNLVKKVVFYSDTKHVKTFPKYLTLVCISGLASYLMINLLISVTPLSVISAKIISESIIFFANFAIQRDFIFTQRKSK